MRARRGTAPQRSQSSIAVSPDGRSWLLVNASVDLPRQCAATPELWVRSARATPFAAVLLTDANVDHTAGLGELRQQPDPLVIVSTPVVRSLLITQLAYERFDRPPHRWLAVDPSPDRDLGPAIAASIGKRLEVFAVGVPGTLPGYAGRATSAGAVVAYVFRERLGGAQLLVAPVFSEFDDTLAALAARSDVVLLDGTFFADDELARENAGDKTARSLGHAPVGGPDGTLARLEDIHARRIFVHLNNTNPILEPSSAEAAALSKAGCEAGYDGMRILVGREAS